MGVPGSGRPRKSAANLKLHGTYRKDRHATRPDDSTEPQLTVKPEWLVGEASVFWDRVVVPLTQSGRAVVADGEMAAGMCDWWREWRDAPSIGAKNIAWKNFVSCASRFGLSPADRAKLAAPANTGQSDFDKDMSKHA